MIPTGTLVTLDDPDYGPWPLHVRWVDGNESHQGMDGLTAVTAP